MMADKTAPARSGEERHRARSAALVRYCLLATLAIVAVAIASGVVGRFVADGALPAWLIYITSAAMVAGFLWFFRAFLRQVDELDRLDTLWAGMAGFVCYYVAFPVWNTLAAFDLALPVSNWTLWIGSTLAMFAAYSLRKAGWR